MKKNVDRREFIRTTAAAGAVGLSSSILGCVHPGKDREMTQPKGEGLSKNRHPNVLFIFSDQLRADALSVYGERNIATGHLDRLAGQGVRFTNAVSSCPLCTPYRGMLMTGQAPTHSGIVLNHLNVEADQGCLAHVFNDAGYRTAFIGKWHLAAGTLQNVGRFLRPDWPQLLCTDDPDFVPPGPKRLGFKHWEAYNFHMEFTRAWYYRDEKVMLHMDGYETDCETDMAIKFMGESQAANEPFFCVVAPHPPHPLFEPRMCPPGYLEKIPAELSWAPNVPQDHPRRVDPLARRCYYAMIKNTDDNVGRILDFLARSGLSDNTIVVFTSDHGEMHGSQGLTNKLVPYAESVNVPLIMRWPGHIPVGLKTDALQTPVDHMTTLCGLTGLKAPPTAEGVDLSNVVLGHGGDNREAVLMAHYSSHFDFFDTRTRYPEWRAVRTRQFTYAKWIDGKEHLFDNLADPYQMKSLVDEKSHRRDLENLRQRLNELLGEADDEFPPGTAYADWYDEKRNKILRSH